MIKRINENKKIIIIVWLLMFVGIILLLMSNGKRRLEVIKQVDLTSGRKNYENKEAGAWKLTKTAKWVEFRKARIEFNFDSIARNTVKYFSSTVGVTQFDSTAVHDDLMPINHNILLVIDTSSSMNDGKLDKIKEASKALIESKISDNNKFGMITFNTSSDILVNLTNDKNELISQIDSLTAGGSINYYKALVNVENVLQRYNSGYEEFSIIFITAGYPNIDTPLEIGQYSILKDKYPSVKIKAIQYEMGNSILEPLTKISDYQYIANATDLNDILIEASSSSDYFEKVEITDYIHEDFRVDSVDDIIPSVGTVQLENDNGRQKVVWTIPRDTLKTGMSANLTIDVILQEESYDKEYVITNEKEEITVKLPDEESETQKTTIRPTLKNASKVIYNGNSPSDCTVSGVPGKKYYLPLEPVTIEDGATCNGYVFKNWNIDNENVTVINKNTFIMPDEDVSLTARWGKFNLSKSMDGDVSKRLTGSEILMTKVNNSSVTNYEDGDKSEMYAFSHVIDQETILTDYRYIGNSPNNYVYFNCSDDSDTSTCEIWRILGLFDVEREIDDPDNEGQKKTIVEKRIKLVKGEILTWDNGYYNAKQWDNGYKSWPNATLNVYLNGEYYSSLSLTAKSQIEEAKYYLGEISSVFSSAENIYMMERNTGSIWQGNIALMYPSDAYMVYSNGVDDMCYSNPGFCDQSNPSLGWLYKDRILMYSWFLNNCNSSIKVCYGYKKLAYEEKYNGHRINPVIYLKSDVTIVSGDGSKNDPYVLE
ncbi:MAG: VWA domain-containing protein [Bacilli bacterium]|nr:VWA domain-containing protein [Bacilli bacterium]